MEVQEGLGEGIWNEIVDGLVTGGGRLVRV